MPLPRLSIKFLMFPPHAYHIFTSKKKKNRFYSKKCTLKSGLPPPKSSFCRPQKGAARGGPPFPAPVSYATDYYSFIIFDSRMHALSQHYFSVLNTTKSNIKLKCTENSRRSWWARTQDQYRFRLPVADDVVTVRLPR